MADFLSQMIAIREKLFPYVPCGAVGRKVGI